jgi:glutaredoxin
MNALRCDHHVSARKDLYDRLVRVLQRRAKMRRWLVEATGRTTVPQIFIGGEPIGGFTDLRALDERGVLERMLAGQGSGHSSSASG